MQKLGAVSKVVFMLGLLYDTHLTYISTPAFKAVAALITTDREASWAWLKEAKSVSGKTNR